MRDDKHYRTVAEAFGRQSKHYDKDEAHNEILKIMRQQVREEVLQCLENGDHILEMNAGTGLDACFFAEKGYKVTATDISEGMIRKIRTKTEQAEYGKNIEVVRSAFHELPERVAGTFDLIFSNMGGLNCEKDLAGVFKGVFLMLKPGGKAVLVIMPRHCPWEWLQLLKGNVKRAFRRYKTGGTKAHLERLEFTTYYYDLSDIRSILPPGFSILDCKGLGSLLPQPHAYTFPREYPRLFRLLKKWDAYWRIRFPFNRWADHLVVTLEKE